MPSQTLPDTVGRYEIVAEIGRGAMGRVFRARDPNVDREVAVKVMASPFLAGSDAEDEEARQRFLLEARAAGRLNHPGIVMVLDADSDPATGAPYIAMELVEGRSLDNLLHQYRRLVPARAVDLVAQAARALAYAHDRGLVHRDIKPNNLLVADSGSVKIADFGIAKLPAEALTLPGSVLGSPGFMSPEQARGEPLDGRSDLFSLGSVLYRALTGAEPFGGDDIPSVLYKVAHVDPRPARDRAPELPESLERVLERALAKERRHRFRDGREKAAALDAVAVELAGGPPAAIAPPPRPWDPGAADPTAADSSPGSTERLTDTPESSESDAAPATTGARREAEAPASRSKSGGGDPRPRSRARHAAWLAAAVTVAVAAALLVSALHDGSAGPPAPPPTAEATASSSELEELASADRVPPAGAGAVDRRSAGASGRSPAASPPPGGRSRSGSRDGDAAAGPGPSWTVPEKTGARAADGEIAAPAQAEAGSRRPEHREESESKASESASLHIVYNNRLSSGSLALLVDGRTVWSTRVSSPQSVAQRFAGRERRYVVRVPAGGHLLQLRLVGRGPGMEVNVSETIRGTFPAGGRRDLRVSLNPLTNNLKLFWTS
ncbi:MAG: protein kinase [Thermoanaerobaculia bacterium]